MSATQTQTATTDQTNPPEIKIFARVASIPMVSSSLESINYVLTSNILTRQPYAHAKVFSNTAYRLTEPLQVRLAPLIVRADGFANKAVDVVESRYPYPFHIQPKEVATYVIERKDNTINGVGKVIGDNVTTPAINVAQGIDNVRSSTSFSFLSRPNSYFHRGLPQLSIILQTPFQSSTTTTAH